jgi:glycine oxidase
MANGTAWDVIIVGQGLAGTALAWCLAREGQRVLLLDNDATVTSSKIAAGLITPITGQRLILSETFDTMFAAATEFYRGCEARTARAFFYLRPAVRLFTSERERQSWQSRQSLPALQPHLADPQSLPLLDAHIADTRGGGFVMRAAQLDVPAYLAASRAVLPHERADIDWAGDVTFDADGVNVGHHRARLLISCEGHAAVRNPHLSWLPFRAAKGDVLVVRCERPLPPVTVHRGIWMAPTTEPHVFRVGSTYDLHNLDTVPSAMARGAIEAKLRAFLRVPYAVIDQHAAVRPILIDIKPAMGLHPRQPRLGFFNGLGSKGALQAPWFAERFTQFLMRHTPLPETLMSQATVAATKAL